MSITVNKSGEIEALDSKKDLIKRTFCKGGSDDELELFMHACKRTGLDPFMKQIYAIKRGNSMTIQTGIDGFRLIAERTGNYSPGRESSFSYDEKGKITSATSYIKKRTSDNIWHEVASTAYMEEYNANQGLWNKMPRTMLAKCAEALALRRAFPAELSGIYTSDEMNQADSIPTPIQEEIIETPTPLSEEQIAQIDYLFLELNDKDIEKKVYKWCSERFKVEDIYDIDAKYFPVLAKRLDSTIKAREASNGSQSVA